MNVEISSEVVSKVEGALIAFTRIEKTPTFTDIENSIGMKIRQDQWRLILDPLHEEMKRTGRPDLPAIIVYKEGEKKGYPPYFSDGGSARSRQFNPNNPDQLKKWLEAVRRVFAYYRKLV